ncbi:interleukin 12 receptor, beta 2a, like [Aplochiton taeniatus]
MNHSNQSVEIFWKSRCDQNYLSEASCEVQYRAEGDSDWTEGEGDLQLSFHADSPLPFTKYEFQVRCACQGSELMSNWSSSYTVLSAEAAPVGKLDVWSDCGISTDNFECVAVWKKLPRSLARGKVLGYTLELSYINGTQAGLNVSTANLTSSLQGVSGASVSAFTSHGATTASPLAMPIPGED